MHKDSAPSSSNPMMTDMTLNVDIHNEKPIRKPGMATSPPRSLRSESTRRTQDSSPPDELSRTTTRRLDMNEGPLALSRIQTARSQHNTTVGFLRSKRGIDRRRTSDPPPMGAAKSYPTPPSDPDEYLVEFDGPDDKLHPQNWVVAKKVVISLVLSFVTFTATFASSVFSPAIPAVVEQFRVSSIVGVLTISLYVLGFATGPILWAPMSEVYGRKIPLLISSLGFAIFQLPVAVAQDLQTIMICRFFGGFFGACPLVVVGAVFADMFDDGDRGLAITALSASVFAGPLLAPIVGGFIVINSSLGWRWTHYLTAILGFTGFLLLVWLLEETYPPIILVEKAASLRRRTKNWAIHAKQEEVEIEFREVLERNLTRPVRMLFTEPIVLMLSIYMAFIYGLLYLFLSFYPIVFQGVHGMNSGVGALPYLGMLAGEVLAGLYIAADSPRYNRKLAENNGVVVPEWRLSPVILGGVLFAIGLFWFGWTGYSADIHWIAPTLSGLCTGFGLLSIFLQCLNYLVDSYLVFAASAIAANTLLRSLFGAVFPLFARYLINGLGVQWAGTLLGCIAALLVPVAIVFRNKGTTIRQKSRFATEHATSTV